MFKYFTYTPVKDSLTTHEFVGDKVNRFDGGVVSVEEENLFQQPAIIMAKEISLDMFKELVAGSRQIKRCRAFVAEKIALKYSVADEIAMLKRDANDPKRVEYEAYVTECKQLGNEMKAAIGYI